MSKDLLLLEKQRNALARKIRETFKKEILKILDKHRGEENWLSIEEIARLSMNREAVSRNDIYNVYYAIQTIRKECEDEDKSKLLVCNRNNRYGWAESKEEIDAYAMVNIENGLRKIKRNTSRLPKNYAALGIHSNPNRMIAGKLREFGFTQLEG
jgi:hypothetical protein